MKKKKTHSVIRTLGGESDRRGLEESINIFFTSHVRFENVLASYRWCTAQGVLLYTQVLIQGAMEGASQCANLTTASQGCCLVTKQAWLGLINRLGESHGL